MKVFPKSAVSSERFVTFLEHLQNEKNPKHGMELFDRKLLKLDGVEDVLGFEETSALLQTGLGILSVEGEGLHILHMSMEEGQLIIDGKINGLFYVDRTSRKGGLWRKGKK